MLQQNSSRCTIPKGAQLSIIVICALVAHLPKGVLQLITAQHELSLGLRAAAQVYVNPIERLLEAQQLRNRWCGLLGGT